MLKLVIIQQGQPDREFVVEGDVATIGRVPSCDVVIDQPFVSKQHLRIFQGTVAIDLKSSNGTYLDGQRLTEAVLLEGRTLSIGQSSNGVSLRVDSMPSEEGSMDAAEQENLRSEYALLEAEVSSLRRELEEARDTGKQDALIARLKGENKSLRERLDSIKGDMEEREVEDGGSVQAKLAMQRVEHVQGLNEKLQAEIDELRAEIEERTSAEEVLQQAEHARSKAEQSPGRVEPSAELESARAEVKRLQGLLEQERSEHKLHGDQTDLVRKLRKELEVLRAGAGGQGGQKPGVDLERALQESRNEAKELRERCAELEGRMAEAPAQQKEQKASDLFFKLQSENAELRRKLASQGGAQGPDARPQRDTKHVKELMEARLRITALEAEISNLKVLKGSAEEAPKAKAKVASGPGKVPSGPATPSSFDPRRVFDCLVEKDVEGLARPAGCSGEEFVLIESLRLLRQVERVVTRVAGDLIQLFQLQTMLPDTVGSYRELVSKLLTKPAGQAERDQLVEYLETLGRWLVASIGAHRKAAALFAAKLRDDLSEKSLTAKDPLPPYARVPMLAGAELWRRVQVHLQALSPDTIDERIEELAREQAHHILNQAP